MKKYEWNRTESNDIEMIESEEGIYVLWSDVKPLIEALKKIRDQDYRGNRSAESQIAFEALKGEAG